jgi:hypothetical protein
MSLAAARSTARKAGSKGVRSPSIPRKRRRERSTCPPVTVAERTDQEEGEQMSSEPFTGGRPDHVSGVQRGEDLSAPG